jgi:hypothetical protein
MNHSISQVTGSRWARGLVAVAATGLFVAAGSTAAEAKMSPPEQPVTSHQHTEWPDSEAVHPNEDACSMGGPVADASEGCGYSELDDPGTAPPPWGGPGERIAVGRDHDDAAAEAEAEAEANATCHGSWTMLDFESVIHPPRPTVYTLTYECS